jgi:O-antigen/teichoic acid export membrane protein
MRQFLMAVDHGSGRFRRYNVLVLLTSAVFPVLLLVLWLIGDASVTTAVCLSLAAPLIGLGFRFAVDKPLLCWPGSALISPRRLVKEGSPYFLSSTVCDLYQRLDLFLVLWMGSFAVQGLYAAAVPAASMLQVGATALALFSFNSGSRQNLNMSRRQLLRAGVTLAGLQLVTGLMFALVIGQLIVLFYGERFAGAVPFALALIPAHAINGFTQVVEGLLRGLGNVRVGIMARVAGAVVMVMTALLLFSSFRELSIPIAATVANGLVAVWLTTAALAFADRERPPSPISWEGNLP